MDKRLSDLGEFFGAIQEPLNELSVASITCDMAGVDSTKSPSKWKRFVVMVKSIAWHIRYKLARWLYPYGWYTEEYEDDEKI